MKVKRYYAHSYGYSFAGRGHPFIFPVKHTTMSGLTL